MCFFMGCFPDLVAKFVSYISSGPRHDICQKYYATPDLVVKYLRKNQVYRDNT